MELGRANVPLAAHGLEMAIEPATRDSVGLYSTIISVIIDEIMYESASW